MLITKSLVDVQLEGGQANYRMLESTRVYAAERLRIRLSQGQQNTDSANALPLLKAA